MGEYYLIDLWMRHPIGLVAQLGSEELTVEACDVANGDALGALHLAGTCVRTVAEA